ncbi:MAG: YopX family protein [Candidatus Woesearchaeota archaeon]
MEEIKFRAWDKDYKKIIYDFNNFVYFDETGEISKLNSLEIMQYTGKKDKNDKEIYEDDIVKTNLYGGSGYDTEEFIGIVKYDKVRCEYRVINDKNYEILGYNQWEKIGNKYENSELLEGVK